MRIEIDMDGNITEHEDAPIVAPTEQELTAQKVAEALAYLDSTDYKMFIDYEPKVGEDLDTIKAERKTARDYIRSN